jgi:hypothetical protein
MEAMAERTSDVSSTAQDRGRQTVTIGLIAPPGLTQELAEHVASALPAWLNERCPGPEWQAATVRAEPMGC